MIGHILVPLDGSAQSEGTLPYAAAIARSLGSRVTLLHATGGQGQSAASRPGPPLIRPIHSGSTRSPKRSPSPMSRTRRGGSRS